MLNMDNPVFRSPFEVPFAGLFVFVIDSVTYLKDGGSLSMVVWAVLKQFSSSVFFAMARAR